jgi:hypothetical protein
MTAVPIDHSHRRREPLHRRTCQPVRRRSRPATREDWKPLSKAEARRRLLALELYQEGLRKPGQRWGAKGTISHGAIGLYRLLLNMAAKFGGRVEPSAAWLARQRNVPVRMIHVWKAQLKEHGFLGWIRRYVETGRDGLRGPQVEQTTNAYWTALPKAAAALVAKLRVPPSADVDTAREERFLAANPDLAEQLARVRSAADDKMARRDRFRLE